MKRFKRRAVLGGGLAAAGGALAASRGAAAQPCGAIRRWDRELDVIVVGCGLAGACAAYEAVRAGATTLIVDSGGAAANASHGTIIYMGGGTALQKAFGVDDAPEEMEKYLLASTGPEPDRERIRTYVERSTADFDWLVKLGVPFSGELSDRALVYSGSEQLHPWRDGARPAPRGHVPTVPGAESLVRGGGAWIQQRLLQAARDAGAAALLAAVAQRIIRSDDGVVQGVIVTVDGREQSFRARRGVVLATGGFARNAKMVSQHAPVYLGCTPTDLGWNDGWGIRAGQSVGGAVRRMGSAGAGWFFAHPVSRRQGILVNAQGQRFVSEGSYSGRVGDAIVREQGGVAWLIVDSDTMADGAGGVVARIPHYQDVAAGVIPIAIAAQAPSIAELEGALGIPPPALQQTVASYDEHASKGEDPFFHKAQPHLRPLSTPPFTAIDARLGHAQLTFFTLGGLHTTPQAEVLDVEGEPIPGLYAAGRVSAGIPCPYYYSSGLNLGECITFGRIAGLRAAARSG